MTFYSCPWYSGTNGTGMMFLLVSWSYLFNYFSGGLTDGDKFCYWKRLQLQNLHQLQLSLSWYCCVAVMVVGGEWSSVSCEFTSLLAFTWWMNEATYHVNMNSYRYSLSHGNSIVARTFSFVDHKGLTHLSMVGTVLLWKKSDLFLVCVVIIYRCLPYRNL